MRYSFKVFLGMAIVAGVGWAVYYSAARYWRNRHRPNYIEAEVVRRTITSVRNSTGEVKPVLSVSIGSFVSGPIIALHVDFNDHVTKDQLLAEIDPRIYNAAVARDRAQLATREAEVNRVRAQLQQAINDERRSIALREESVDYISETEIDRYYFGRKSLEAQLVLAEAAVDQANATLANSEANLGYTKIRSPVDGIVIDRKIDPGQTLAAQFQTPELFVIAPQMDEFMQIFASVDEADIGAIRKAQMERRKVHFTVDAFPDDLFEGEIEQIRFSSTVTQNVVTYPVVVRAPNADMKLLPGMTADLSFEIDKKENALCVPNAALRFYPDRAQVREVDYKLLDGANENENDGDEPATPARDRAAASQDRNRRHVWIRDAGMLRSIEIVVGISDYRFTEVVSGDVKEGCKLVTGIKTGR